MELVRSDSVNIHRNAIPIIGAAGKRLRGNKNYSTTMRPNLKYTAWLDAPWSCDNVDMQHVLWIWELAWKNRTILSEYGIV
jgi:hypothetical protein